MRYLLATLIGLACAWVVGSSITAQELASVTGRVLESDGGPSVGTTVHLCRQTPQPSCQITTTDAGGRFTVDLAEGSYYFAFTTTSMDRWYYHADSDGGLISTGRRPERSFIDISNGATVALQVQIPQQDFVEILMRDSHAGDKHNARVDVAACREGWTWGHRLPQCLLTSEAASGNPNVRRVRSPVPDEPYYFRFSFVGYALGEHGGVRWYYDQGSSSGLTNDYTRATIFSSDNRPPSTLRVTLPDLPRSITVNLHLHPGVNTVGWFGGRTSLVDLARHVPSLKGVVKFPDRSSGRWKAYAVGDPDTPVLTPRSYWWFYVASEGPISIEIETPVEPPEYPGCGGWRETAWGLEGESSMVWSGPTTTLEHAISGMGKFRAAPRVLRVAGSNEDRADSGLVRSGDILVIDSPRTNIVPLPCAWQPDIVLQGPPDEHWRHFPQRFADVQSFFWNEYGIRRDDITVYYRTAENDGGWGDISQDQCGSGWDTVTLVCGDPHSIAKFYFRSLQWIVSDGLNRPGWLIEGAMEYAAAQYTQHAQGRSGDPVSLHRLMARNDAEEQRTLEELSYPIQSWGDDPAATRLAALAVDWLVRHSGDPDSLFDVFRRAYDYYLTEERNHHDWERAFEEAFGISAADFYDRFAEFRANGFRLDQE